MENIAYVQFDSVETAKKYKEMDLEINSVPISSKFVPDRMSAERKRTKGTKWEKKKAAKREAAIAEKKAQNGDDSKAPAGKNFYDNAPYFLNIDPRNIRNRRIFQSYF